MFAIVCDSGSRREIRGRLDTSRRNNERLRTGSVVISNGGQGGGVEDRRTEDCSKSYALSSHCHPQHNVTLRLTYESKEGVDHTD